MTPAELERIEELLAEDFHLIEFRDNGWTIAHPLRERLDGSLFDCSLTWDEDDPGIRGRFKLHEDGRLGRAVYGS